MSNDAVPLHINGRSPFALDHTRRYVESGGAEGHDELSAPSLVLTTTGRRSGESRHNALIYGTDGNRYVIVASKGGNASQPHWYVNLVANPEVSLLVGTQRIVARARTAEGNERARLWDAMVGIWPEYADYQSRTDRQIPVVVLEPQETPESPSSLR